ncbi:TetR family transcriptional regulator C-terminal domain-containing protein [Streptomyces diastatochromogenes]|nr:TetR family transcriptional regulator C-terminal domain-containing protein [Streptomyces diastatochromogenes]
MDRALGPHPGNAALREAQAELDTGWQEDLESLLAAGAARGRFAPLDAGARASELLALLDGLSTRMVLGQEPGRDPGPPWRPRARRRGH